MKKEIKSIRTIKDFTPGEIKSEETVMRFTLPSEPNYIKFYVDNITDLFKINNVSKNVLMQLLRISNYDNIVNLPGGLRQEIISSMGISYSQLDNSLRDLQRQNLINKKGVGVYIINPLYFGKGSWDNIFQIKLETVINKDGIFNITVVESAKAK